MTTHPMRLLCAAGLALAACSGAATAEPASSTGATSATAAPSAHSSTTPSTTGGWTVTNASKATVTVHEQLVGVSLPSDAVLTGTSTAGSFAVNADGSFSSDSQITLDLTTLASDQSQRDSFIKQSTLQVRQFPTATFVPTRATGLALPLADGADLTFTLTGRMTIHGVTKDVTFDVVARRSGSQLTATATAAPTWKFEDFGMTAPSVPFRVVSVTDEIRLVVTLVATGAAS